MDWNSSFFSIEYDFIESSMIASINGNEEEKNIWILTECIHSLTQFALLYKMSISSTAWNLRDRHYSNIFTHTYFHFFIDYDIMPILLRFSTISTFYLKNTEFTIVTTKYKRSLVLLSYLEMPSEIVMINWFEISDIHKTPFNIQWENRLNKHIQPSMNLQ